MARHSMNLHRSFFLNLRPKPSLEMKTLLNKMIKIDDKPVVKVTGVYKDFPNNSTFTGLNFISTWDFLYNNDERFENNGKIPGGPISFHLFVQLNDNADFAKVSERIKDAKLKKVNPQLQKRSLHCFYSR